MRRRHFIATTGGALLALPTAAGAQQPPAMPVIGFLGSASPGPWANRLRAFHQGLGEAGYVEGRNVAIAYRWAETRVDRFPALATDLVQRRVAVIAVIGGVASALAAKAATATIPIVFRMANDPVESGLVASISRPGGNVTGISTLGVDLAPKQLDLLRELIPGVGDVAALVNPANPINADIVARDVAATARKLGLRAHVMGARSDAELEAAFAELAKRRVGGVVIQADLFFNTRHDLLAALALRHGVPAISPYREFTEAGGLMSYGGGMVEGCRLAGVYVGRVLKGARPADLPVQQVTKVELVVNLKTAQALGIAVPRAILARADEVLE